MRPIKIGLIMCTGHNNHRDNWKLLGMTRALELAQLGTGKVSPNPLVGCTIIKDNVIIAEGWHKQFGAAHAEADAISKLTKHDLKQATLICNLEPCSHHGKTPPCAEKIVACGIKHVVISQLDPNPCVSGRGVEYLEKNGVRVEIGLLEKEAKQLNHDYNYFILHNRPFFCGKWAMSLDGKMISCDKNSKISNAHSNVITHQLRQKYSAIIVGVNTVIADDPVLNSRLHPDVTLNIDPAPIILDSNGRTPLDSRILSSDRKKQTIIAVTPAASIDFINTVQNKGHIIWRLRKNKYNQVDLQDLSVKMMQNNICSALVEGGKQVLDSFFSEDLIHQSHTFIAPNYFGKMHQRKQLQVRQQELGTNYYFTAEHINV